MLTMGLSPVACISKREKQFPATSEAHFSVSCYSHIEEGTASSFGLQTPITESTSIIIQLNHWRKRMS